MLHPAELAPGDHACCAFDDAVHKQAVVGAFALQGLRCGERVALYTRERDLTALLGGSLADTAGRAARSGQLVIASAEEGYFSSGGFDGPRLAAGFAGLADAALSDGFSGLRVYADNGWMPAALPDPAEWLEYELLISQVVTGRRLIGLCGFDPFEPSPLSDAVLDAVHPVHVARAPERASSFHFVDVDGHVALTGEIDAFCVEVLLQSLQAARPLLGEKGLSLAGITFADGAAVTALTQFVEKSGVPITQGSPAVERVRQLLATGPAGTPS